MASKLKVGDRVHSTFSNDVGTLMCINQPTSILPTNTHEVLWDGLDYWTTAHPDTLRRITDPVDILMDAVDIDPEIR